MTEERRSRRKSPIIKRLVDNDELESILISSDSSEAPIKNTTRLRKLNLTHLTPEKSKARMSLRKTTPNKRCISESPDTSPMKPKKTLIHRIKSFDSPKTPKKNNISTKYPAQTPHHIRTRIKKVLNKIKKDESSTTDISGSESDFIPDEYKENSSEEEEEENDEDKDEEPNTTNLPMLTSLNTLSVSRRPTRQKIKDIQDDFVLQSDDYFSQHSTNKALTSDRTLDSLKTPRLEHDQLFKLLKTLKISKEHEQSIGEMMAEHKSNFNKWLLLLYEEFNLLFYGLGSKLNLLKSFHEECLSNEDVLVVNGFFPGLNFKDILDNIANKLMNLNIQTSNVNTAVDCIEVECTENYFHPIYLIIHNIDGIMLRNDRSQTILSRLAKIKNIHLIASIDHINAPLLWNASILSNYNFSWWDVTTMLPYQDETAFENSLLVQNSGALVLSSMKNVFQSLTVNAKGIYLTIVKHQTANKTNQHYQGMAFRELYSNCREAFLVSSDLALRAQLTEFLDHKLVKLKRANDGTEYLNIPLENKLLLQFLEHEP